MTVFKRAGYSNGELLKIATVEAARFMGEEGKAGIVAAGARADLILLRTDPEVDLEARRSPLGVMVAGHWHTRTTIDEAVEARAARMDELRRNMPSGRFPS